MKNVLRFWDVMCFGISNWKLWSVFCVSQREDIDVTTCVLEVLQVICFFKYGSTIYIRIKCFADATVEVLKYICGVFCNFRFGFWSILFRLILILFIIIYYHVAVMSIWYINMRTKMTLKYKVKKKLSLLEL